MNPKTIITVSICVLLATIYISRFTKAPALNPPVVVDLEKSSVFLIDTEEIHDKHGDVYRTARGLWKGLTANFIEYRTGPYKGKTFNLYYQYEHVPRQEDRYIIINKEKFYLHRRMRISETIPGGSEAYDREGDGFSRLIKWPYGMRTEGIMYDLGPHKGRFFRLYNDHEYISVPWEERVKHEYITTSEGKYYLHSLIDQNGHLYVNRSTTIKRYRRYLTGPHKGKLVLIHFDNDRGTNYIIIDEEKLYIPSLIDKHGDSYVYHSDSEADNLIWIRYIRYSTGPYKGKDFEVYFDNYYDLERAYIITNRHEYKDQYHKYYFYNPRPADKDRAKWSFGDMPIKEVELRITASKPVTVKVIGNLPDSYTTHHKTFQARDGNTIYITIRTKRLKDAIGDEVMTEHQEQVDIGVLEPGDYKVNVNEMIVQEFHID